MDKKNLVKMNASAGSGKTFTLTNRFVDLLFQSDIGYGGTSGAAKNTAQFNFSELLAITFTNLAANQMKEKVIAKLKQYALKELSLTEAKCNSQKELDEKSTRAHGMLEKVFQQYGALNIRTIDSFLNQIIGGFALELGYPPRFETRFDSDVFIDELYTQLSELSIAQEKNCEAGTKNYAPLFHELCRNKFDNSNYDSFFAKAALQQQIRKFVEYYIEYNYILTSEELAELEENYKKFKDEKDTRLQKLLDLAKEIETCIAKNSITVDSRFLKALKDIENKFESAYLNRDSFKDVVTKANKSDYTEAVKPYAELKENINKYLEVLALYHEYSLFLPAAKLAAELYVELVSYEKENQCLNTKKMPHMIASLLGEETGSLSNPFLLQKKQEGSLIPAAYCRLGTRLKHILYDEFQDTSVAQWNALKDLSSEVLANAGSVFFVGDVKQAIYGWRGGRASLFSEAPAQLKKQAMGFADDNLPCNWRSAEYIVAWNNIFFQNLLDAETKDIALFFPSSAKEIFPEEYIKKTRDTLQENYKQVRQGIAKKRLAKMKNKGVVEVHTLKESDTLFDTAVLSLLPEMVRKLHKKYHDYSKIAILTVNNNQASCVSQILLDHAIPVVSQGSLGLKEHPVIIEVIAFLRFLDNPLDESAFCQVLLSRHLLPQAFYEACSAQELFGFFVGSRKGFLFSAFRETYKDLWKDYFQVLVDGANLLTAYDTLCEVYNRMGIMERNPKAAVYLLRLKELAYLAEEKGIVDLHAFLTWWEENGEKENAPLPEGVKSVSVLTMHKSKGLEYEAVIIPWHNFRIDVQDDICKFNMPFEDKLYPVYAKLKKEYGAPYYEAIADKIKECINLLYVAWTRAKEELHIFIPMDYDSSKRKKDGTSYYFIKAFLEYVKEELAFIQQEQQYVFEETEDCFRLGEERTAVVSEKTLRSLEYLFALSEVENIDNCLSQKQRDELASFLEEYIEEKEANENEKNKSDEPQKTSAGAVKIPPEDVVYAAKRLSRVLCPDKKEKQEAAVFDAAVYYEEKPYNQEHSMDWLPQLRIFRSDLDELMGAKKLSSNKRGTLIHKSLEYLVFSGNLAEDCKRAAFEAMKFLPYGRFSEQDSLKEDFAQNQEKKLYGDVLKDLTWFAELKEPFGGAKFWFEYGYKEHSLTNENGELFRIDLLVEIPEKMRCNYQNTAYIAIDYKTGYPDESLPVPDNKKQILNYIDLLTKATGKKAVGVLVYLDRTECCIIESE